MRFEELNWMDVEKYLKHDKRVMLILGSSEQHGYLSLLTDALIPSALADAASEKTNVLVTPPLNFGATAAFKAYPGTISVNISTLMTFVEEIVESLYATGFRQIVILNGHGGNEPVRSKLGETLNKYPDLKIRWYAWWMSHSVEQIAIKHDLKRFHAGWLEAFPFTKVAELPEGSKLPPHVPGLLSADDVRKTFGDGVFGGEYQVSRDIMDEMFIAAVEDIIKLLDFTDYK